MSRRSPSVPASAAANTTKLARRKRTKTFTGCWTCRARKIKCDEAKPHCQQCRDKHLACEGYGSRLQWLSPETGYKAGSRSEMPSPAQHALRRHIPAEPPASVLSWSQVDGILRAIDSWEAGLTSSSKKKHLATSIQNFGVFSSKRPCPAGNARPPDGSANDARSGEELDFDFVTESLPSDLLGSLESFASPSCSEAAAAWDLCNLQGNQLQSRSLDFHDQQDIAIDEGFVVDDTSPRLDQNNNETSYAGDRSLVVDESTSEQTWPLITHHPRNLPPNIVSEQERFLMNHYMNKVVNLLCVIENAKSPWKTIHLPRVLQCAGELSFGGQTTRIRNALRNALLSISAFYLSNDHQANNLPDGAKKWGQVAARYRYDAIGLLKEGVENDLYTKKRPKYKEFLATMLSMITINVFSGDTGTCSVHLDGAEQLISHMSVRKSQFSRKAQALHRIYLYLRVIHESTSVKPRESQGSRFPAFFGSRKTTVPEPPTVSRQTFIDDQASPHSRGPTELDDISVEEPTAEMAAYECIYGIPRNLIMVLKDTIELIDQVEQERERTGSLHISEHLDRLCDELEKDILDWAPEGRLKRFQETNKDLSGEIIYHQTRAFHNALIIYFSQNIRMLGHRYLRPYVETMLDSIEAVERMKTAPRIHAAPLFWPAFIGATEAFDPQHQERFRRWHESAGAYGIEAVRTGIQVIHEVWRRGPSSAGQLRSCWRRVVAQTGDTLMLT